MPNLYICMPIQSERTQLSVAPLNADATCSVQRAASRYTRITDRETETAKPGAWK
jgi:hypothetical protein